MNLNITGAAAGYAADMATTYATATEAITVQGVSEEVAEGIATMPFDDAADIAADVVSAAEEGDGAAETDEDDADKA